VEDNLSLNAAQSRLIIARRIKRTAKTPRRKDAKKERIFHFSFVIAGTNLEVQQHIVALRRTRGEMIIEGATQKSFPRSSGAKQKPISTYHCRKHCAPTGARVIEFVTHSIKISLRWSETRIHWKTGGAMASGDDK
jgi:hypothetical protein